MCLSLSIYIYIYRYNIHTHTSTYIYIYIEREIDTKVTSAKGPLWAYLTLGGAAAAAEAHENDETAISNNQ